MGIFGRMSSIFEFSWKSGFDLVHDLERDYSGAAPHHNLIGSSDSVCGFLKSWVDLVFET